MWQLDDDDDNVFPWCTCNGPQYNEIAGHDHDGLTWLEREAAPGFRSDTLGPSR